MVHREPIKVSKGCGVEPQEVAEGGEGESQHAEVQTLPSSFLSSIFYIGVVKRKKLQLAGVVEICSQGKPFIHMLALHLLGM